MHKALLLLNVLVVYYHYCRKSNILGFTHVISVLIDIYIFCFYCLLPLFDLLCWPHAIIYAQDRSPMLTDLCKTD